MWIATEARTQGQDATLGMPTEMARGRARAPEAAATRDVATIGSTLSLRSAFQPAWKAAAVSTARKTKRSMAEGAPIGGQQSIAAGAVQPIMGACAACRQRTDTSIARRD